VATRTAQHILGCRRRFLPFGCAHQLVRGPPILHLYPAFARFVPWRLRAHSRYTAAAARTAHATCGNKQALSGINDNGRVNVGININIFAPRGTHWIFAHKIDVTRREDELANGQWQMKMKAK